MFRKVPPLIVHPESPFAGDALSRQGECERLVESILAPETKTPFVLAVNAPWGAGKTVFLKMVETVCKAKEIPTVFFNAWEADFHNDALAAMIGEVGEQIQPETGDELAKVVESVKESGRKMLSLRGLTEMVQGALKSVGNAAGLTPILEGALESLRKFDPAAGYREYRNALEEFKKSLAAYVAQSGKPLVFFVDELDRCRPIFAVEVLEKIKHIFDVEGVFFVVAVNKGELAKTIRSVYGDIDAEIYLRKFFDGMGLNLTSERRGFASSAAERANLFDGNPGFLAKFCDMFSLQPRDQEQVLCDFESIDRRRHNNFDFEDLKILGLFAVLSYANPPLFKECMAAANSYPEFPFAKLGEIYLEKWHAYSPSANLHDELARPWRWCCINGYIWDEGYRQDVARQAGDAESAYAKIKSVAEQRLQMPLSMRGFSPDPETFPKIFGKIGRVE